MNQMELERTTNEHVQSKLAGQVSQARENALLLKRAIQALDLQVSALRNEKMKWTQSVQIEREKLFETDKEIQTLENRLLLIQESLEQFKLKMKKVNHSISKLEDEMKTIRTECDRLVQSNVWILQERSTFGIQGSEYEFSKINIQLLGSKLKEKKEALRKQSGSINRQVNSMTESLEKQETQLKENLNIVKQDKTKIEETIHKLNIYEQEALDKTWKKVNKYVYLEFKVFFLY
jgi:structural maintenance of chromosome 2